VNPRPRGACRSGRHDWIPENLIVDSQGYRHCRVCADERADERERLLVKPPRKYPRKPYTPSQPVVSAQVGPELHATVRKTAQQRGVTISQIVREGLSLLLENKSS
jgi:hypothetical protein